MTNCVTEPGNGQGFSIERNDPRPFRIHCGPDETAATKEMMRELADEVRRVTGVEVEVLFYAPALAGDFFVATEPWAAEGAWTIGNRNGVMGIHGSDPQGTEAALRHFIDTFLNLEFARHRNLQERIWNEKPPRREVCLNLDVRQLGLGGASCGPRPEAEYIFPVQKESWMLSLSPLSNNLP